MKFFGSTRDGYIAQLNVRSRCRIFLHDVLNRQLTLPLFFETICLLTIFYFWHDTCFSSVVGREVSRV